MIVCRLPQAGDFIVATGIPPDIITIMGVKTNLDAIHQIPKSVGEIIEEKTILAQSVTPDYIKKLLEQHHSHIQIMYKNVNHQSIEEDNDNAVMPASILTVGMVHFIRYLKISISQAPL